MWSGYTNNDTLTAQSVGGAPATGKPTGPGHGRTQSQFRSRCLDEAAALGARTELERRLKVARGPQQPDTLQPPHLTANGKSNASSSEEEERLIKIAKGPQPPDTPPPNWSGTAKSLASSKALKLAPEAIHKL